MNSNIRRIVIVPAVIIICLALPSFVLFLPAQNKNISASEFKLLVEKLSQVRLDGSPENEADQAKAVEFLDSTAVMELNASSPVDLDGANQRLARLASHDPPVGENYRLVSLGGLPAVYALVVNFGLGGPAAIRIFANIDGHYVLAGKVDRFSQMDFFDSDLELLRVPGADKIFVTISGRTDDLRTGIFVAWRFDGRQVNSLWSSDLLQQSKYEMDADGFHLTYCAMPSEERPSQCLKMESDTFRYLNGEWKRVDSH